MGCVIVRNNVIIAKSHNCKESKKNSVMHAELLAVDRACQVVRNWRLDDCILYTTLEPCMMCMGAIIESRIPKVFYGTKCKNEQMYDVDKIRRPFLRIIACRGGCNRRRLLPSKRGHRRGCCGCRS